MLASSHTSERPTWPCSKSARLPGILPVVRQCGQLETLPHWQTGVLAPCTRSRAGRAAGVTPRTRTGQCSFKLRCEPKSHDALASAGLRGVRGGSTRACASTTNVAKRSAIAAKGIAHQAGEDSGQERNCITVHVHQAAKSQGAAALRLAVAKSEATHRRPHQHIAVMASRDVCSARHTRPCRTQLCKALQRPEGGVDTAPV